MTGSPENNSYFGDAGSNEEWLRREIRSLHDEAIKDSPHPDIESLLVREIAKESVKIDFEDLIHPEIEVVVIKTTNRCFRYKPIGLEANGLVVKDIDVDETILLRGTAYCMSLDSFWDKYSFSMFDKHFLGRNYPASTVEGSRLSVPFVAAKGQIGQNGYLVVSDVYTRDQVEEVLISGDVKPQEVGLNQRPDGSLVANYMVMQRTETVQYPIFDIDFECKGSSTF